MLAYSDPIGYYIDFADGKLNRNLTSKGLVPDSGFDGAKASGKIAAGYPCIVAVPSGVSDGAHVRPDKNVDKPKNPKP